MVSGRQEEPRARDAEIHSVYIVLTYATWVFLVAIASTAMFGLCVVVVVVQEALKNMRKTLSRVIPLEKSGAERRSVVFDAPSTPHSGDSGAHVARL